MACLHRFLCWNLRTACFVGYILTVFTATFALTLRLVDLIATATDFEISMGFKTLWRAHFWQSFLASDIVLTFGHVVVILYSGFMILQVMERHFVMYMRAHKIFIICFIIYILVEFAFSVFEYTFYSMNTFRLSFVVFTWLFWVMRTLLNVREVKSHIFPCSNCFPFTYILKVYYLQNFILMFRYKQEKLN
ncbi:uncharacterized protein LOC125681518 isoform X1 [Ostrea edulis]|uniref:uncharacterized protein LOC125681518 isoform X1 n=1 Tax=Ostrea edulis TaxID=37623 RepID=UPI0024AEA082|nr:uncharacterized protein LOC125681518 isoform X1 [Ostrea edulis]